MEACGGGSHHKSWRSFQRALSKGATESNLRFFFFFNLFIYLAALGLSCSMWDLVP